MKIYVIGTGPGELSQITPRAMDAIKEANVALVPGDCFGCEGHIRLSYCVSGENLDKGLNRLSAFISTL